MRLLVDQRLSADGTRSCFTCHQPALGFTDGLAVAEGGSLNTPPLWGLAERERFGWFRPDVTRLEQMALLPLADPAEMGPQQDITLDRLRADPALRVAYQAAFPDVSEVITWAHTAQALAAAIRTLEPPVSAYDRALAGDVSALTPAARRGQALFAELGCQNCHQPPRFASESYHAVGVADTLQRNNGRARVPSLRGVHYTAPYFHNGSAATLADVIRAYERGGQTPGAPISPAIQPLLLTEEDVWDLVAFLEAL
jgi:cytochrome c peroxidase